jgi:hypothetical protein
MFDYYNFHIPLYQKIKLIPAYFVNHLCFTKILTVCNFVKPKFKYSPIT